MQSLAPPDIHYLSAAAGWIELGNLDEAKRELDRVSPAVRQHRDVLELRWSICSQESNWDEGLKVANALLKVAPDEPAAWLYRAYALRRAQGGGEAGD